jgi:hypothetical protein
MAVTFTFVSLILLYAAKYFGLTKIPQCTAREQLVNRAAGKAVRWLGQRLSKTGWIPKVGRIRTT